jgi:hypothetical protein
MGGSGVHAVALPGPRTSEPLGPGASADVPMAATAATAITVAAALMRTHARKLVPGAEVVRSLWAGAGTWRRR